LSLVSFFGEKSTAAPFGTFATISALFGHAAMSDLSQQCALKRTSPTRTSRGPKWFRRSARYSGSETPNIWQKCSTVSAVEMSGFGSRAFIHRRAAADEIRRIVSEPVEAQEEMKLAA
jgi:hypothetical protein